jgi:hypothetical protein
MGNTKTFSFWVISVFGEWKIEGMIQREKISFSPLPFIAYLAMVVGLYVLKSAWISFAIYHGLILCVFLFAGNRAWWKKLIEGWSPGVGLGSMMFGITGGIILYFLAPWAGIDKAMLEAGLAKLGLQGAPLLLFTIYHALVNPWFEEILWRGKLGSDSRRLVLNDFLFSGYHLLVLVLFMDWWWMFPAFGILTVSGWFWRQIKRHQKGLVVPVLSHLAADASIMLVVLNLLR